MELLDSYLAKKRQIADQYRAGLQGIPGIKLPEAAPWASPTFWLYTVQIDRERYGLGSRGLMAKLRDEGIQSRPLWHPLHSLPPFKECSEYKVEPADHLYQESLSLPCSVGLDKEQQERVIQAIKDAVSRR